MCVCPPVFPVCSVCPCELWTVAGPSSDHCEWVVFADWIRIECFSRGSGGPGPGPDRGSWCWADWPVACSNFFINVNKYAQYLFTILSILLALASSLHKQAFTGCPTILGPLCFLLFCQLLLYQNTKVGWVLKNSENLQHDRHQNFKNFRPVAHEMSSVEAPKWGKFTEY